MTGATIHVDWARRLPGRIHPFLFGHFIEFIRDGISAMQAELLACGHFAAPDDNGDGAADPWTPVGGARCRILPAARGGGDGCQEVTGPAGSGISWGPLPVRADVALRGRLTLAWGGGPGTVRVALHAAESAGGALLAAARVGPVGPDPADYPFELVPAAGSAAATLSITLDDPGTLHVERATLLPADHRDGWRADVLDAIAALRPAFIRFPGGCFADAYHWRDGVGPAADRPARPNRAWFGHVEDNRVGTAEFIALCRQLGCEPQLVVNFGSGTPAEAAAWVQYCNGGPDTPMGRLRAAHGYPDPFGVRCWEIGNETWGSWEIGHTDADTYARRYRAFAAAMRAADPSIRLIATGGNGNDPDQAWNRAVCAHNAGDFEYLSLHYYAPQLGSRQQAAHLPEADIYRATAAAALKLDAVLDATAATLAEYGLSGRAGVMVNEYNAMYQDDSNREQTLGAAILNATLLNLFLRRCDLIWGASLSDLVAGWEGGMIRPHGAQVWTTPSHEVFRLYATHGGTAPVPAAVDSPSYASHAMGHLPAFPAVPLLDAAATMDAGGNGWLFVVNRSDADPIPATLAMEGLPAAPELEAVTVTGGHPGVTTCPGGPAGLRILREPAARAAARDAGGPYQLHWEFPPCSVTRFRVRAGGGGADA